VRDEPWGFPVQDIQHLSGCVFVLLATTLVGFANRIATKICAHAYGQYINRLLGRPQWRIKELWA
jgi:hypothetical protein